MKLTGPKKIVVESEDDTEEQRAYLIDDKLWKAVAGSWGSGRPLLLKGEPGIGKTGLAVALAYYLERQLVSYTVNASTTVDDLLWSYDPVSRLAKAQIYGALGGKSGVEFEDLSVSEFVSPGPLWQAYAWGEAEKKLEKKPELSTKAKPEENGCVLLIDEIDKANREVPNALLEALGGGAFCPPGSDPVRLDSSSPKRPLVIIASNSEKGLPEAFERRCLIYELSLPKDEKEFVETLILRGKAHFPQYAEQYATIFELAAQLLFEEREEKRPGQAEYLDLLRIVFFYKDQEDPESVLDKMSLYTLKKYKQKVGQ